MSPKHDHGSEPVHGKDLLSQNNMAAEHHDETLADDWEEWEDDDVVTLIDVGEPLSAASTKLSSTDHDLVDTNTSNSPTDSCDNSKIDANIHPGLLAPPSTPASIHPRNTNHSSARASRHPVGRISRLRSKRRQKAQNARLGIRLITDMSKFRRQNHVANQMRSPAAPAPKFVDAAALRALEGSPTPESVGSWNWLKRGKERNQEAASPQQYPRSPDQGLSPEDRPIVIGITLPSEEVASRGIDPQTATVNTIHMPFGLQNKQIVPPRLSADQSNPFSDANQPKSVWSPDTPDTADNVRLFGSVRPTSSVYSQATMCGIGLGVSNTEIPPVPALPAGYKKSRQQRLISLELGSRNAEDDDDTGTPCTLFEEDGNPTSKKSPRGKLSAITPDSAGSRSQGWWDHVVTPFLDKRMSFASRNQKLESSIEEKETRWGKDAENKGGQEFLYSSKENKEPQSSKAVTVKTEDENMLASTEKMKQPAMNTVKFEGNGALLDLSNPEGEQPPSTSLNTVDFSKRDGAKQPVTVHAKEDHTPCPPTNTAGTNNDGILITLATEVRVKQPAKRIDIKQALEYLAPPKSKKVRQSWKHAEEAPSSSKVATAKEDGGCMSLSNEGQGQQPRESILHSERKHMPPPKESWQQVQPQERSIPTLNESNMREQQQPYVVVDRVQMNSTPTLRIPTPRRTPSPRAKTTEVEAPYESLTRCVPDVNQLGRREKTRMMATDDMPADYPPPYSPPKKQAGAPVRYQAVFPPDHHLHITFTSPQRTASPGLAWTMTSQGGSRTTDDPLAASSQASIPSSREACQIKQTTRPLQEETENRAPISGAMFLSVKDIQEVPPVIQRGRAHDSEGQVRVAPPPRSITHGRCVPEQQSRFSLSPTSSTRSRISHEDARGVQRFIHHTRNYASEQQTRATQLPSRPVGLNMAQHSDSANLSSEQRSGPLNWSGGVAVPEGHGYTKSLPIRPAGTYLPQEHAHAAPGHTHRVERQRRRHEKEEVVARRMGGFWRGRGCIPEKGCFGRAGPEGRKKRRIWMGIVATLIALIILAIVLATTLTRHHGTHEAHSIWVNLTDFPPMPTGILTVVGPDNTVANSGCTEPSTLWSCYLPKDDQASVAPYKPNQPTVVFQIQWDNSTSNSWNVPNGNPPIPISQKRDTIDGFSPDPSAPAFQEMWFLGETTDNVESNEKAGEPAPFFISMLESVNDTVGFPTLSRRQESGAGNGSLSNILPAPDLEADGTPTPAVMLPNPVQQPVRLYDRGLSTEHYGFYTYFKRTIFLKSVTVLNQTNEENVPLDQDGGCSKTEANYLVTWAQTRVLVQIWTRKLNQNNTSLLTPGTSGGIDNSTELIRPGTMPYPVTVTLDTHGGDPNEKVVWEWPMNNRQQLNLSSPELLANNMAAGGTWINHRGSGNASYGGFDGGTGGCKCQWVNWV